MKMYKLTKIEKEILRKSKSKGYVTYKDFGNIGSDDFRAIVNELGKKGLINSISEAVTDGFKHSSIPKIRISEDGESYFLFNPKLRNPLTESCKWWIHITLTAFAVLISFAALLKSFSCI